MEYLYHGSPQKLNLLVPNQAHDTGFAKGCQLAVYATSNKNMAILFSLGCQENGAKESKRTMMPEYGDKMIFENCHPNYGEKGYVYVLDKSQFTYAYGTQWVCYKAIKPIEIMEINVDDYLNMCVIK